MQISHSQHLQLCLSYYIIVFSLHGAHEYMNVGPGVLHYKFCLVLKVHNSDFGHGARIFIVSANDTGNLTFLSLGILGRAGGGLDIFPLFLF